MIVEMVTCDICDWTDHMRGGLVPAAWISGGGHHYCSPKCAIEALGGDVA